MENENSENLKMAFAPCDTTTPSSSKEKRIGLNLELNSTASTSMSMPKSATTQFSSRNTNIKRISIGFSDLSYSSKKNVWHKGRLYGLYISYWLEDDWLKVISWLYKVPIFRFVLEEKNEFWPNFVNFLQSWIHARWQKKSLSGFWSAGGRRSSFFSNFYLIFCFFCVCLFYIKRVLFQCLRFIGTGFFGSRNLRMFFFTG